MDTMKVARMDMSDISRKTPLQPMLRERAFVSIPPKTLAVPKAE
jgi:hypothetical protein